MVQLLHQIQLQVLFEKDCENDFPPESIYLVCKDCAVAPRYIKQSIARRPFSVCLNEDQSYVLGVDYMEEIKPGLKYRQK